MIKKCKCGKDSAFFSGHCIQCKDKENEEIHNRRHRAIQLQKEIVMDEFSPIKIKSGDKEWGDAIRTLIE